MGACCGSQLTKQERFEEMIKTQRKLAKQKNKIPAKINYYSIYDKLNTNLNNLLEYLNENKCGYNCEKINFTQLYNIFLNLNFNYAKCNYIIIDLRDKHNENCLKVFKMMNFSLDDLLHFNSKRIDKIKNFLNNKNIIFIANHNNIETIQHYIEFFELRQCNIKNIYFFDTNLDTKSLDESINILLNAINYSNKVEIYPYILFPLSYIQNMTKKGYIFIQILSIDNLCDIRNNPFLPEYLSNSDLNENDEFLQLCYKCNIACLCQFLKGNKKSIIKEILRKRSNKDDRNLNYSMIQTFFNTLNYNERFGIEDTISLLKNYIEYNGSVVIQIDSAFDDLILVKFIFILIYKFINATKEQIMIHLQKFILPINHISSIIDENENEILNTVKLFGLP